MKLRDVLKDRNPNLYNIFKGNLVKASELSKKCTPPEYTFHDFENHTLQVEKYVDNLLQENFIKVLSDDEIFILLNGIHYHDIGMISKNRKNHNVIARDMIYNFKKNESFPYRISVPNVIYAKSISWLCYAHRDNDGEKGRKTQTLNEVPPEEGYTNSIVHTSILACILRLADELDITYSRAPENLFREMKDFLSEKSKEEWQKHQFLRQVEIRSNSYRIILIPNKDIIKQRDKASKDRNFIRKIIFAKIGKIEEELDDMQKFFKVTKDKRYDLGYQKIDIDFDNEIIKDKDLKVYKSSVSDAIKRYTLEGDDIDYTKAIDLNGIEEIKEEKKDNDLGTILKQKLIKINENLDSIHQDKQLIRLGYFCLPSNYYSRYFINTNFILTKREILDTVTDIFYEKFKNLKIDFIIGVDKSGILLGPNLSLKLKCNFTYLIHPGDDKISNVFEKKCSLQKSDKILIIIDVIASGSTIRDSVIKLKKEFKVKPVAIGTVFSRDNNVVRSIEKDSEIKVFSINDTYQLPVYSRDEVLNNKTLKKEFGIIKIFSSDH